MIKQLQQRFKKIVTQHPQASFILPAFVILALIYSVATPPFEAGDESRHYAVVKYMADTGRLPVQNVPETQEFQTHWSHEGNQPPLYYGLAAALTARIDTGAWEAVFWYNPHTTIGNPLRPDNKNITIHPPGSPPAEAWPWRGHVLAVRLIRLMSIGMATVTVITCYAIALKLFKGRRWPAAGAMAITAFNPMFIFISSSINNDNAVIMFVTLAVYQLIIIKEQLTNEDEPLQVNGKILWSVALLGLLIGLGALSKLYAFGLLPLAGLIFIWAAYSTLVKTPSAIRNRQYAIRILFRNVFLPTLILSLVFIAVAGWFYLRNAILYDGDIFALQVMRETAGQRSEAPTFDTIRAEFKGFRIAYWALFGGVNILVDDWIYLVLDGVSLVAFLGLIAFLVFLVLASRLKGGPATPYTPRTTHYALRTTQSVSLPTFFILLAWSTIMLAGFIVWNLTQPAGQGRLLYPAISAISALGMLGLTWWLPTEGLQKIVVILCIAGLFLFSVLTPFLYIAPVYAKPPVLTEADLPPDIQPANLIYDDAIRLIGYQLHTPTVRPAEAVRLTLYWQLLRPTDLDYSLFVHLLGRQRAVIGQIDTYPGEGHWPTTLLSPGDIVADTYHIPVAPGAEFEHAPARLQIAAGVYDFFEPGRPGRPAVNAQGEPVDPIIAAAKLVPWQWPEPPELAHPINFFDKAKLLSYKIAEDQQSLTLNWQVEGNFETDYTVFIQAWRAATDEYAAGFDGPPVQGHYPTSLWSPGEIIVDTHPLNLAQLPPGTYDLIAGLYNPKTGDRLPAFGPDGPLPDYAVHVGRIQVAE